MTPIPPEELHGVLSQAYSDLFKELNGIRPRWMKFDEMPTPKLESAFLSLQAEAEETFEDRQAEMAALEAQWAAEEAAELEVAAREAIRAHEERWMDRAAERGAEGW